MDSNEPNPPSGTETKREKGRAVEITAEGGVCVCVGPHLSGDGGDEGRWSCGGDERESVARRTGRVGRGVERQAHCDANQETGGQRQPAQREGEEEREGERGRGKRMKGEKRGGREVGGGGSERGRMRSKK